MPPQAPPATRDRRWLVLAVLGLAQLMVVLDATIVNIALPAAQADLGFGDDDRQWVITGYALAFGSLLLLGGRLADRLGRRNAITLGLTGFALASAVGGVASSFEMLVAARVGQGAFAALLAPSLLSTLNATFPSGPDRAKAFGVFGAIAGSGAAVGLLVGGALTEVLDWRWCLLVNLVIAVPAAAGVLGLVEDARPEHRSPLDLPGTVLVIAGLLAVVLGFSQAETEGWTAGTTVALLSAGPLLLVGFVVAELKVKAPVMPMRVLLERTRGGSFLAVGLASAGLFGAFLFLTYYLQQTLGMSAIQTGLAFLPMIGGIMLSATVAVPRLQGRVGARVLPATGALLGAGGMALLAQIDVGSSYWTAVLPGLVVLGLGTGLVMAPSLEGATYGLEGEDASTASALVSTSQQVLGAVATAVLTTLSSDAITSSLRDGAGPGSAAVDGYAMAFWVTAGIYAVGAVVLATLLPSAARERVAGVEPVLAH